MMRGDAGKYSLDWFWDACAATGPLVMEYQHAGKGHRPRLRVIAQPYALCGSGVRNDLCLADPDQQLSRRQVYFQALGPRIWVTHLGGAVPTYWETSGEELQSGWLPRGAWLRMGNFRVRIAKTWYDAAAASPGETVSGGAPGAAADFFSDLTEDVLPPVTKQVSRADFPEIALELSDLEGRSYHPWRLKRFLNLMGSSRECLGYIRLPGVLPIHCAFLVTSYGLWALELGESGHGLVLNGMAVRSARLDEGDELIIGSMRIRPHYPPGFEPRGWVKRSAAPTRADFLRQMDVLAHLAVPTSGDPFAAAGAGLSTDAEVFTSGEFQAVAVPGLPSALPAPESHLETGALVKASDASSSGSLAVMNSVMAIQQRQMGHLFGQFQHVVLTTAEVFKGLQREQAEMARREMERIRHLNEELDELQSRVAHLVAHEPYLPAGAVAGVGVGDSANRAQSHEYESSREPPRAPSHPLPNIIGPADAAIDPAAPSGNQAHYQLFQRIHNIQRERQTTMQKLMSLLGGDG